MASFGVGKPLDPTMTGNIFNVALTDHRLKDAGIDPKSLIGHGITENELNSRLSKIKKGKR